MSRQSSNITTAVLAAILANTIWGLSFMATRIATTHVSPSVLLCIRFTASFLIMLLLHATRIGKIDLKGKPIGKFLLMGLCEPVIYFFSETYGIKYTNASFSGLIISLIPAGTALLSAVFLKENLSLKKFAWILISVAGVILVSVTQTSEGSIQLRGVILLLVAMLSAAFYSILSRSTSVYFSSFERTFVMMTMGFVSFTAYALFTERSRFAASFAAALHDKYVIFPVLFLTVFCSVIAFYCMNYGMTYLEVSRASIFTNIIPVVSVIAGVTILGEPFSAVSAVGIVLILSGVYMVNKLS